MTTSKKKKIMSSALFLLAAAFSGCASSPPAIPSPPHCVKQVDCVPATAPLPPPLTHSKLQSPKYPFHEQIGTFTDVVHSELEQCVRGGWTSRGIPLFKEMLEEERYLKIPLFGGYIVRSDSTTIWPFLFLDRNRDGQPNQLNKQVPKDAERYMDYIPVEKLYSPNCAQHLQPQKIIKVETTNGQMTVVDGLNQAYTAVIKLPEFQNGFGCDNLASPPFPWEQIRELYGAFRTSDNARVWLVAYYPPRQFANGTLEQELQQGLREGMLVRETVPGECGLARDVALKYASSNQDGWDCVTFEHLGYPHNIIGGYGYQPKISYEVKNKRVSLKNCFGDELK